MKTYLTPLLLAALLLAGCETVANRISKNQAVFDAWPAQVQATIRAERVDLGFTPDQVRIALGAPDRVYARKTSAGEAEVWAYFDRRPQFSIGVGMGSGGYGGGLGGGVVYDRQYDRMDDAQRVVFEGGVVTAVEARVEKK
ncbi:MAG: hypothetical protein IT582_09115 [Opitutaceae bacterium]|nr:hypothetical protein [Opitutaceae bacterium]